MKVELCPKCGSGKLSPITSGILETDPSVKCMGCGWTGQHHETMAALQARPTAGVDSAFNIVQEVASEYLRELVKHAGQSIGMAMVTSGLVGTKDKLVLVRLIRAACIGAHRSTLDEIEKIQEEIKHGGN